jgi:formate dehydrogenase subunit beta
MTAMEQGIRDAARQYLENGDVSFVIGYERGPRGVIRPAFIYEAGESDRLVWGPDCNLDLVTYLHNYKHSPRRGVPPPKVGVVVRPCDARALNLLLHEEQIERENVKVIGLSCAGTQINGEPRVACQFCRERVPVIYDVLVESDQPIAVPSVQDDYADVAEMDGWTPAERLAYWTQEFDRCIRCYACRQACPGCYCFECLAEQVDPQWVSIAHGMPQKAFFHIMRAYHLAGRCVQCHACDEACPMEIPLSLLNRKIAREVQELFGYSAGSDPEIPPPLATFRKDEELPL